MLNKENMILLGENKYKSQIISLVDKLLEDKKKMVLITGPSGSGKTTTAKRIADEVEDRGFNAVYLSMDDWFRTKSEYQIPITEDGKPDFESPICLDIPLLNSDLNKLLNGEVIDLPTYDFVKQEMFYSGVELVADERTIVIVEGLHAFNPKINLDRTKVFKVFVRPENQWVNNIEFTHEDIRLYRRISRDKLYRGRSMEETLYMLSSVSRGEKLYLNPYIQDIDVFVNTFIDYELYLHKSVLGDFEKLQSVNNIDITIKDIPQTSLLTEFYL